MHIFAEYNTLNTHRIRVGYDMLDWLYRLFGEYDTLDTLFCVEINTIGVSLLNSAKSENWLLRPCQEYDTLFDT